MRPVSEPLLLFAGAAWLVWGVGAATAVAQEAAEAEAVEISYEAPAGCPDSRDFSWRVSARARGVRAPKTGEPARRFHIAISRADDGAYVGLLDIANTDGTTGDRSLRSPDCAEVSNALALIVALAIDPHAKADLPSEPPSPTASPKRGAAGGEDSAPVTRAAAPRGPTKETMASEAASSSVSFGGGVAGRAFDGPAPNVVVAGGVFGQLDLLRRSVLSPSLRLSLAAAPESTVVAQQGAASFAWFGGDLAACPLRVPLGDSAALRTCAAMELGVIVARGSETTNPRSDTRPWVTPRLEAEVDVRAVAGISLQLHGGIGLPLVRDDYAIGTEVVHTVPPVTWALGLRLGLFTR